MDSVDMEVLHRAVGWLDDGRRVLLVTVIGTWGSSPRPVGALAAIREDGLLVGSVSGGCVEDDLIARHREGEWRDLPVRVKYGVTSVEARRFGLPCGGTLEVLIEPRPDAAVLADVLWAIGQRRLIGRRVELASGANAVVEAPEAAMLATPEALAFAHGPRWRMLIIGAAQSSRFLAEMALALDYQVTVCDPRAEYAEGWSVAGSIVDRRMPDDVVVDMRPDSRTVVITLSHDPKLDDMALLEALKSPAFYVGALGSHVTNAARRKRLAMFDLTPQEIARLRGPVGLPIGSRTPPEIAVAILAELTALRSGVVLPASLQPDTGTESTVSAPCQPDSMARG